MPRILVRGVLSAEEREKICEASPHAEVIAAEGEDFLRQLPSADILWGALRPQHIPLGANLRLIQVLSAGVDHMLSPELTASKAILCTTSGIHQETISEHVLGMMICLVRRFSTHINNQIPRRWEAVVPELLYGQTLGILGFGAIGQALGQRAQGMGMKVIGIRRNPKPSPFADVVVAENELEAILPRLKHLVVALPLTPATDGVMTKERLALLPTGSYFYNIARGKVVDEAALAELLANGHLAGAGLDVFHEEPLPEASPLWSIPNVMITPHCAGSLPDYRERALEIFLHNLRCLHHGQPLRNIVDKDSGY